MVSISNKISLPMCAIVGLVAIICVATTDAELQLVNVLFRHGDRTPDDNYNEMYPNDPYLHSNFYPMGRGQLTNQGKLREYDLGKVLREKYAKFLGDTYTQHSVSGLSSDYDRTKMSLQLVLAGLFPPNEIQRWNPHLSWQPIPAKYLRRYEDNLFLADECPLYLAEYDKVLASQQGQNKLSKFNNFMHQLTEWSGKNISSAWDMFYMYHTLMAEYSLGLTLPDWAYTIFPRGELWNATVFAYDIANSTPLLRRLYGGPYLRKVMKTILDFTSGKLDNERKAYLYGGHETNIAAVLHALGVYMPHVPEYSSAILMELHRIDKEYYVKYMYYLGIPSKIIDLQIPGCEILCPLSKYLDLTEEVIPTIEELFCDKGLTQDYINQRSKAEIDLRKYNLIRTAKALKSK